jgi:2,4-dienoyl-CoA reductase-like NADH-dependent reductase (Old Yellow Enzyme family)
MDLFDDYNLSRKLNLRNRIVMAPMTTWSANDDLTVSDQELEYYRLRAKGVGMLITATTFFTELGQGFTNQFSAANDDYIPSLKSLADCIKEEGAKAVLQVFHAGRMANAGQDEVVSASAVKPENRRFGSLKDSKTPRALTIPEIEEIIEGFYQSTKRAILAGFDGVEIHGANTYLIQQFYSPHTNLRNDQYGGSREKRLTFPLRVVDAVERAVKDFGNSNFVIGYRFSPEEIENPGITMDDTKFLIDNLCQTKLDYLHISLADFNSDSLRGDKVNGTVAEELISFINGRKPFIGVGSINNVNDAYRALTYGFDLVAVGRAIIANPSWVQDAEEGIVSDHRIDLSKHKELVIPDILAEYIKNRPGWFDEK